MSSTVLMNVPEHEYTAAKLAQKKVVEILKWPEKNSEKVAAIGICKDKGKLAISVHINDGFPGGRPVLPKTVLDVPVKMFSGGEQRALKESRDVQTVAGVRSNRQKMTSDIREIANHLSSKFNAKLNTGWPPSFKLSTDVNVIIDSFPNINDEGYVIRVRALPASSNQLPLLDTEMVVSQIDSDTLLSDFIKNTENQLAQWAPQMVTLNP